MEYIEFLRNKMAISHQTGFEFNSEEITPTLYPHVKDTVRWAVAGGCRAIFSSFGMQKTVTQLEILRVILNHKGGKGLIACGSRVPNTSGTTLAHESNLCPNYGRCDDMSYRHHGNKLRTCA